MLQSTQPTRGPPMSEPGRFARVALRSRDGATAEVCRHGAQVLGWQPRHSGRNLLYLSERSVYADGAAIRGGIPVVFPQFSVFGPLPKHGFVRGKSWQLRDGNDAARTVFECGDDDATRAVWPHRFRATLEVTLGDDTLDTALSVTNVGDAALSFTAALHTYFAVRDVATVRVRGLRGAHYLDATADMRKGSEGREAVAFDGEFDRVFPGLAGDILLEDGRDRITIARTGFADAVVWNPGAEKAAGLGDLAPGDHRHFVCIEPAVFDPPVVLSAGATWRGVQRLRHSRAEAD